MLQSPRARMAYQSSISSPSYHSQNGAASIPSASSSWRSEADTHDRNAVKQELFEMFSGKVTPEYTTKLILLLEDRLYAQAASLDEYKNRSTLQARTQSAAKIIDSGSKSQRTNPQFQGASAKSSTSVAVGQLIPTPGTGNTLGVAKKDQAGPQNGQAPHPSSSRVEVGPGYPRTNGHPVDQGNGQVARPGVGGKIPANAIYKVPPPGMTIGMPGREVRGNSGAGNAGGRPANSRQFGNGIHTGGGYKGGIRHEVQQQHQMPYQHTAQQVKVAGALDTGKHSRVYVQPGAGPGLGQGGAGTSAGAIREGFKVAGGVVAVCQNVQGGGTQRSPVLPGGVTAGGGSDSAGPVDQNARDQKILQHHKFREIIQLLLHARSCQGVEKKASCPQVCPLAKQVLKHQARCTDPAKCQISLCTQLTNARRHFEGCRNPACYICIPIRHGGRCNATCQVCCKQRLVYQECLARQKARQLEAIAISECKARETEGVARKRARSEVEGEGLLANGRGTAAGRGCSEEGGLGLNGVGGKRLKVEGVDVGNCGEVQVTVVETVRSSVSFEGQALPQAEKYGREVKMGLPGGVGLKAEAGQEADGAAVLDPRSEQQGGGREGEEGGEGKEKGNGKVKGQGTSLTELFTPEMIHQHVDSLRHAMSQMSVDGKGPRYQPAVDRAKVGEECCKLCHVASLFFDPPPIYCTSCGKRIQRQKAYYSMGQGEAKVCVCTKCFGDMRGDTMVLEGVAPISRAKLEKKQNNDEADEGWVQCTGCNGWVHQICALFNIRRNGSEGDADFTCPLCCAEQMEEGERDPLPPTAVLGAKDLPRTVLSDKLEARLGERLRAEREDRARTEMVAVEEVPQPDELVVRVVSSVDKKLDTKPRFLGIFPEGSYPSDFPYKSKVVLLFQKIEGVEVCLFGMYVQEFGSECHHPNQRRVYLSYLDSVKYFRPELRTVQNEALRTFVYHEILIGYLDYCKSRGFTSCYIWACPPLKGEDYILYCHPEIQKTPQPAKLREWYLAMLRKAQSEGIVVEVTNLYETFFIKCGESKLEVSAARLPYFDGDYWPGAIEEVLEAQEVERAKNPKGAKKGAKKKLPSKRGKGGEEGELSSSPDRALMDKLGDTILTMKEDFILVNMHYCCSYCRAFILGDRRYTCAHCPSFQLCPGCHASEVATSSSKDRHPVLLKDVVHELEEVFQEAAPQETQDADELMESEFFDTRQNFLSLCQGNHYQYDTLRRAKHSSMMVLYHLHNPTAPGFVATCNVCHKDIDKGIQWRCNTCDFDICDSCQSMQPNAHPHPLSQASSSPSTAQNVEGRQQRVDQMRAMLGLLQHASHCSLSDCTFHKCRALHRIFQHGSHCRVRAVGGCAMCKHMWKLLKFHAKTCKEKRACMVPRCKDLKEHMRRLSVQDDTRRRAAVQEMARMRTLQARGGN